MPNNFTKQELAAFDDIVMGVQDSLTISRHVKKYDADPVAMENSNDTIQRPVPYILNSQDRTVGTDVTPQGVKQLSVPATLGFKKNVTWQLTATQMRNQAREKTLGMSAKHRIASDINSAVRDVVSLQGTQVVKHTSAASSYDQIAEAESLLTEQGVQMEDRCLGLFTRDYNGLSGDLAGRGTMQGKPTTAYERSLIAGPIAGFDAYKLDTAKLITAQSASITMDTTGAQVQYEPKSSESTTAGEINVDNRTQDIVVSSNAGLKEGDAFTIAGVYAVHGITKESTGNLKTFRVRGTGAGNVVTISPPIIGANQGSPTDAEKQYKNAHIASTSGTAAITFLNTADAHANPFWCKDSVELIPGSYEVPDDQGVDVVSATTEQGLQLVMSREFSGSKFQSTLYLDCFFGVVNLNPEMNGIMLFNQ